MRLRYGVYKDSGRAGGRCNFYYNIMQCIGKNQEYFMMCRPLTRKGSIKNCLHSVSTRTRGYRMLANNWRNKWL